MAAFYYAISQKINAFEFMSPFEAHACPRINVPFPVRI